MAVPTSEGLQKLTNKLSDNLKSAIREITPNAVALSAPGLLKDILRFGINPPQKDRVISYKEILGIKKEILEKIKEFDQRRKLAYHNVNHTRSVFKRVGDLAAQSNLSTQEIRIIQFASLFHDYIHGYRHLVGEKKTSSFEILSADEADVYARKKNLSIRQRIQIYGMIIATTFSVPEIQPVTTGEKLLVIADLGGFINSGKEWLMESWQVTQEIPYEFRPKDLTHWLTKQEKFLEYVSKRLTPEAINLSWHKALEKKKTMIRNLAKNARFYKSYLYLVDNIRLSLPTAI